MSTYKHIAMEMARYNKWQNSIVFELCGGLDQTELDLDRGAFFGSLTATLNHILYTDHVLLEYIHNGEPPSSFKPKTIVHGKFSDLWKARQNLDEAIIQLMDEATEAWLDETFSFHSDDKGAIRTRPRALMISQMFNHQTHHRSQATYMLHQLGFDYGSTDMPFNPLSQT
ncbi:MAG: damage-inducible protein DinB [Pseudomonadales bacterium]|nr:damage-inducible protein DinB [Pseudomonadales bacterium]